MSVHNETALAVLEGLKALKQKIPNLVIPVTKDERKRLSAAASVPAEFVERLAVAVETTPRLVRAQALRPDESRDLMSYAEAFGPVADEIEALAGFLRHSVTAARNKAGAEALTTYALAQRLAARPDHADLAPHVADMRRALGPKGLGAKGRRAKAKAEPSEPPAQPPVTTTAPAAPATPTPTTQK